MLLIDVEHPLLVGKKVCLKTAAFLSGPKILVDGVEAPKKGSVYVITNYTGNQVEIRIRTTILDPVPVLEINGERFDALPQLSPVEYIWVLTPLVMTFVGGGIGGLLGGTAMYANVFIFRSKLTKPAKYLVTGGVTTVAMLLYLSFCMLMSIGIRGGEVGPARMVTSQLASPDKQGITQQEKAQEIDEVADKVAKAVVEVGLYENETLHIIRKELLDGDWLKNNCYAFQSALQTKFDQMGGKYKAASSFQFDLRISDDADSVAVFIKDRKLEVKPKD